MIDEQLCPIEKATISAHDRGIFFGDGVYEVIICCCGRPFEMDRHMARLENSLRLMDMLEKVDPQQVCRRVHNAIAEAHLKNAVIYFHITRGTSMRSHNYADDWQPNFFLTIRPHRAGGRSAITAITHPDLRWKLCCIKSLNLLANVLAKRAAVKAGSYEAILVADDGLITEGSSTSVFMIKDDVLRTAPLNANILPGITRDLILEWADGLGLEGRGESFTVKQALAADELMITGTTTGIMAVTALDGRIIADGQPGNRTKRLAEMLDEAMGNE